MKLRLSHSRFESNPAGLKELFLKEIFFQALLKDWATRQNIKLKKRLWSRQSFILFLTDPSKLKALQRHQSFIFLKSALLEELKKQVPDPSLKAQKKFYQKNKTFFKEPAQCHLQQIVTADEKPALFLYNRVKKGEDFSTLAQNHSLKAGPGWIKKGQLKVFDQACFNSQESNQNSLIPPIKSPYGYHVFLKTGFKPSKQKSFAESQKKILSLMKEKKASSAFQNWLKEESFKKTFWIDKKSLDQIKIQYKKGAG